MSEDTPFERKSRAVGFERASRWLLALAIAGSALAVGAVHTMTLCVVAAVLTVAAGLAWWNGEPMSMRPAATLLLCVGVSLTGYTALQCVPIPIAWLSTLAGHNADVWSRALLPLRQPGPAWAPVTLDPSATRVEVLKGVAYLLAFLTALRVARHREGAMFLSEVIVLTGLVLGAAALLHPAFGAHKLFGIYEPQESIAVRHIAPLMNPNNLAGYLNIALCLALGASLAREPAVPRPIAGAAVLLLGATQLWVASRGGVVSMVLGVTLVFAVIGFARSREARSAASLSVMVGVVAAAGAAMIVIGGSDEASNELLDTDVSKVRLVAHAMRMLPAVPFFGCGRGAFESAFPAFRTDAGYLTFSYPENVVAQWILEWGFPVGCVGLVAVAYALRPSAVLARSATAAGAWGAVVAVTVQNFWDLGSEIPGPVLAGTVCAAIVVAGAPGHRPRRFIELWARAPRGLAIVATVVAATAIEEAARGIGHELHDDQRALYDFAFAHSAFGPMRERARAAMLRHPAEPYLPFIAALRALNARDESPIPWIGATLERANVYGYAHLVLARTVLARSASQARFEFRLAIEQMPALDSAVAGDAPRVVGGYSDAMELVPTGKEGTRELEMLVGVLKDRLPATCVRLDAELAARAPTISGPPFRAALDAVEDVEAVEGVPWCTGVRRESCSRDALEKAKRAQMIAPRECAPYALEARVRIATGETAAGLSELQAAADDVTDRVVCLQALEKIARAAGDETTAQAALDRVASAGCNDDAECAHNLWWVAARSEATGSPRKALSFYRRAYERSPQDDELLATIARLAAENGLHAEAADSYERLARRHPEETRWRTAAAIERQVASGSVVTFERNAAPASAPGSSP
jgi:tetratricopeptide (TPR) repeat protein